jgi:hypothetical protein
MIGSGESDNGSVSRKVAAGVLSAFVGVLKLSSTLMRQALDAQLPEVSVAPTIDRAQIRLHLDRLRSQAVLPMEHLNIVGESTLNDARVVFLNEDPRRYADLEAFVLLLRDNVDPGDVVIFENIHGQENLLLEQHLLARMLTLEALPGQSSHFSLRHRARTFHVQLNTLRNEMLSHRILPEGAFVHTWQVEHEDTINPIDALRRRASAQMQIIQAALQTHRRIFLIRNRAFSVPFIFEQTNSQEPPLLVYPTFFAKALEREHEWLAQIPHIDVYIRAPVN